MNKIQEIFSKGYFNNDIEKKNKILEILICYFEKLINEKIYGLIDIQNKNYFLSEIDKIVLLICENSEKKNNNIYTENNFLDLKFNHSEE
jgi:hypothetical protein